MIFVCTAADVDIPGAAVTSHTLRPGLILSKKRGRPNTTVALKEVEQSLSQPVWNGVLLGDLNLRKILNAKLHCMKKIVLFNIGLRYLVLDSLHFLLRQTSAFL